jgi:hypothetical protein
MFGFKREEVMGLEKLHDVLHNLYFCEILLQRSMKENETGWSQSMHGHMINVYKIMIKNLKGLDYIEGLGIDGRVKLNWILTK